MPSLAVRPPSLPAAQHTIPMHAKSAKRSGQMPPDLYAALQFFFTIAQKEMQLPRVPTVEEFLLASCAIEPNSDMNATLQAILGRCHAYTFLTNVGVVLCALVLYNVCPYHLHGLPVDVNDAVDRISAGYRWYVRFAFSSAGLKTTAVLPQVQDWLVQTAIPYIEATHQPMLEALEIIKPLVATRAYKKAINKPIMHAIAATGKLIQN